MRQYLELLEEVKNKGTLKPAAREGMPGTISYFGTQLRHNLADGFPLITTKKMFWKGVVVELLWFLRGDTNIKYLVDNEVNIWNEDAYNYYKKVHKQQNIEAGFTFEEFVNHIKVSNCNTEIIPGYKFGDCGYQYAKLWRAWETKERYWDEELTPLEEDVTFPDGSHFPKGFMYKKSHYKKIDQLADIIKSLKESPMSRRHIITAWNPATLDKMALNACHVLAQFNCRPLNTMERMSLCKVTDSNPITGGIVTSLDPDLQGVPKYYLDCQMYQRSADVVLGVPFNIASYALLTHILAKICNMVPGDFVHTFGDVHIYENHMDAVNEQLTREPRELPRLELPNNVDWSNIDGMLKTCLISDFSLMGYNPHPKLESETKLSTGLKK